MFPFSNMSLYNNLQQDKFMQQSFHEIRLKLRLICKKNSTFRGIYNSYFNILQNIYKVLETL